MGFAKSSTHPTVTTATDVAETFPLVQIIFLTGPVKLGVFSRVDCSARTRPQTCAAGFDVEAGRSGSVPNPNRYGGPNRRTDRANVKLPEYPLDAGNAER